MKKIIVIGLVLILFLSIINISTIPGREISIKQNTSKTNKLTDTKDDIYGIIIPIFASDSEKKQGKIAKSINDLLREKILVYWLAEDVPVSSDTYNKGSFLIPFTGSSTSDKVISIVNKYNVNFNEVQNPPSNILVYKLNEPKIAYFDSDIVSNWFIYNEREGGFTPGDGLSWKEIPDKLNTNNFNIFIWPGGNTDLVQLIEDQFNPENKAALDAIRSFVSDGGGYVGSCYGGYEASYGFIAPTNWLKPYLPELSSFPYLSIVNCWSFLALPGYSMVSIKIKDSDCPVNFGINEIVESLFAGGPMFFNVKGNTKTLAVIEDVPDDFEPGFGLGLFDDLPQSIADIWAEYSIGKAAWVTSNFGEGRVVAFGDHPEGGGYTSRVVYNSLFYVTSDGPMHINARTKSVTTDLHESSLLKYFTSENNFMFRFLFNIMNLKFN